MKYLVLAVLLASAYAAEETVEVAGAQMPFYPGGMMSMQGRTQYNEQGYMVDATMFCSNTRCSCAQQCVPWTPCQCKCPPRCPPEDPEINDPICPPQRCPNNAGSLPHCCANGANNRYCCPNSATNMWCCLNGAANEFCCTNGANSQFCCLNGAENRYCCENGVLDNPFCCANGAQNPECSLTQIPDEETPDDCNRGGCCIPCMPCRPCQVWWQCQPCQNNCHNGCQQMG